MQSGVPDPGATLLLWCGRRQRVQGFLFRLHGIAPRLRISAIGEIPLCAIQQGFCLPKVLGRAGCGASLPGNRNRLAGIAHFLYRRIGCAAAAESEQRHQDNSRYGHLGHYLARRLHGEIDSTKYKTGTHQATLASALLYSQVAKKKRRMDLTAALCAARVSRREPIIRNQTMPVTLTIYHNPKCSKSRKTLQLIRDNGIEPKIIEYLRCPPEAATILKLADWLGIGVADLLRTSDGNEADETLSLNEQSLARWLQDNPAALQRPIVVDEAHAKACIGRPPENVLALLRQ